MRIAALSLTLCLTLPLASLGQTGSPSGGDPVAIVAGQPISEQELRETLGPQWMQLRMQEYEQKRTALESLIRLKLVQAEAKRRGISPEKLLEQEAQSKVSEPTDAELEAFLWGQAQAGARLDGG